MRSIPKHISLEKEGVRPFLKRTKKKHNGLDDADLDSMLNSPLKYTKTQIARAFNVSRDQLYTWLRLDPEWLSFIEKEQDK